VVAQRLGRTAPGKWSLAGGGAQDPEARLRRRRQARLGLWPDGRSGQFLHTDREDEVGRYQENGETQP
jgi:hypothetical protein